MVGIRTGIVRVIGKRVEVWLAVVRLKRLIRRVVAHPL